jgi:hypothetical protein
MSSPTEHKLRSPPFTHLIELDVHLSSHCTVIKPSPCISLDIHISTKLFNWRYKGISCPYAFSLTKHHAMNAYWGVEV